MALLDKLKSSAAKEFAGIPSPAMEITPPKSQEFKVTQTFNGYKDPHVFGVVVEFEYLGLLFVAYVDFPAGETFGGEILEIADNDENAVEMKDETVLKKIMEAAKQYIMAYYSR